MLITNFKEHLKKGEKIYKTNDIKYKYLLRKTYSLELKFENNKK